MTLKEEMKRELVKFENERRDFRFIVINEVKKIVFHYKARRELVDKICIQINVDEKIHCINLKFLFWSWVNNAQRMEEVIECSVISQKASLEEVTIWVIRYLSKILEKEGFTQVVTTYKYNERLEKELPQINAVLDLA